MIKLSVVILRHVLSWAPSLVAMHHSTSLSKAPLIYDDLCRVEELERILKVVTL